jgi:hypothetical protein
LHVLLSNRVSHCVFISPPPDAPVVGGAGSGPVAAAAPAPVVASAAGYRRRRRRRRERGEGKEVGGAGDEGVGYRWRRRALAPIVAAVAPALIIYCNKSCTNRMRGVSHEQPEPNHTKTITRNIILSTTNTTGS